MSDIYQTDEWETEKHVPVIDCPDSFVSGEMTAVVVQVGKEIDHPNTTDHHVRWIRLYFIPDGSPFAYEIGSYEFEAHGASVDGPNTSTVYTNHKVMTEFRTEVPGTLHATAFCNIHGLWESWKRISIAE
ncbi:MAG: Neelaredoxin [Candidatus Eisenbacteria bacterium]|nr:Neelaredoxin [Candidatus Eisenbacteria bacterium]